MSDSFCLSDLPNELLQCIANHCDSVKSVAYLKQTCHQFYDTIEYRPHDFKYWLPWLVEQSDKERIQRIIEKYVNWLTASCFLQALLKVNETDILYLLLDCKSTITGLTVATDDTFHRLWMKALKFPRNSLWEWLLLHGYERSHHVWPNHFNLLVRTATLRGYCDIVRDLLEDPACRSSVNMGSLVSRASSENHIELVEYLLHSDLWLQTSPLRRSAAMLDGIRAAACAGHFNTLEKILDMTSSLPLASFREPPSVVALQESAMNGHWTLVEQLLSQESHFQWSDQVIRYLETEAKPSCLNRFKKLLPKKPNKRKRKV